MKYLYHTVIHADQPDIATQLRVHQSDSTEKYIATLNSYVKLSQSCRVAVDGSVCSAASYSHCIFSQGCPALRATKKLPATDRVTPLTAVFGLLLPQALKLQDKNAMSSSKPASLCSQVNSTEQEEHKETSKYFDLPNSPSQPP